MPPHAAVRRRRAKEEFMVRWAVARLEGVEGNGIWVWDGELVSGREDGIALYFRCVWVIGIRGFH